MLTQIVRWADNTDQLRRNLSQGLDVIESTKASAEKMVKAMSGDKLIESAHRMVAALSMVERGVKALSPQEAAQKLALLERAMDKLERTGRPVPTQMRQTAEALRQVSTVATPLSARFSQLGSDVLKSAAGFATGLLSVTALQSGFRLLTDFVKDTAKAFMDAEKANAKIDASLRSSGRFTPQLASQYRGLAEEMQRLTVNSDDANAESIALFVSLGRVGPENMQRALQASADLSAALGKDLTSSTELLSKAFNGNVTGLQKLGIQMRSTADKGQQFENVIAAIADRFGGQASAAIETNIGQAQQLANAWDNVKEIIGAFVVQSRPFQMALQTSNFLLGQQAKAAGEAAQELDRAKRAYNEYLARAMQRGLPLMKPGQQRDINLPVELPPDYVSRLDEARRKIGALTDEKRRQLDAAQKLGDGFEELATKYGLTDDAIRLYSSVQKEAIKDTSDAARAAEKLREEQERLFGVDLINQALSLKDALGSISNVTRLMPEMQEHVFDAVQQAIAVYKRWGDEAPPALMRISAALAPIVAQQRLLAGLTTNPQTIAGMLQGLGTRVDPKKFFPTIKTTPVTRQMLLGLGKQVMVEGPKIGTLLGRGLVSGVQSFASQLGDVVLSALTGGGNIGRSVGALFGQELGRGLAANLSGFLTKTLGKTLGGALTSLIPGVGGMLGSLIGALFGPSWRTQLTDFAQRMGGTLDDLRGRLHALGDEGARLWERLMTPPSKGSRGDSFKAMDDIEQSFARLAEIQEEISGHLDNMTSALERFGGKAPKALQPMINMLLQSTRLTEAQRRLLEGMVGPPSVDALREAAERYGKTLDDLGPQAAQLGSNETFDQLFSDFTMFEDLGADSIGIMGDAIQKAVDRARRMGLDIPEYMRPVLQKMLDAGRLTDEFGNSLKSLDDFSFSASIESSLDRIADLLERIATALNSPLLTNPPIPETDVPEIGGRSKTAAGGQTVVNVQFDGKTVARGVAPWLPDEVLTLRLA